MRKSLNVKRLILKIGSSSLVREDHSVNEPVLVTLMSEFFRLKSEGIDVALVTSGAIAVGMHELHLSKRPKDMALKQACAAVGQAKLMESYNKIADIYGLHLGQILVNHDDFQVRKRMLYLSNTLDAMFKNGIIPVINENDALAVEEIKVGDNDTLASLIAPMISADLLVLFSDIDGLYTKNPKLYPDATLVSMVSKIDDSILKMIGGATSDVGTGGMETKIDAALIATMAGCNMIICNANRIKDLSLIAKGEEIGTLFAKTDKGISSRDHWMIFKTNTSGTITVDNGVKKLMDTKKITILPKGVVSVSGEFLPGAVIEVKDMDGMILAKGISNLSSADIEKILGMTSKEAFDAVGFISKKGIIHADDLVILKEGYYGRFVK